MPLASKDGRLPISATINVGIPDRHVCKASRISSTLVLSYLSATTLHDGVIAVQQLPGSFNVLGFEVVSTQLNQGVVYHYIHLAKKIAHYPIAY